MWLIILAVAIVLGLAGYAGYLLWQVKQQRIKLEASRAQRLKTEQSKHDYVAESCRVIARHIVEGELNISEGAIRLKVLLDNINLSDIDKQRFVAFERLYEQVKDLDTHDARAQLTVNERKAQDRVRHKAEYQHQESVTNAAKALLEFDLNRYRPS
ncbi:DUF2489 domain-containing protein [Salinibius halmophilus]|uniref:DUF2489 domain-containing protein n=1 Tax=Salinibius halmophilus TaxID=1853216 RepID=UPI000E66D35F|nr:DUF2489 domain-containing protein [Salinibius halmophilus]